ASVHSILTKHEQGAVFMACGQARSSGQVSACITTAGPGATNLVTGIANAYSDNLPVLAITGESPTHIFGKGGLQESSGEGGSIDQSALFSSISRYHKLIERTDYLHHVLAHTTQILLSERPGPVVLSLPYNLQKEEVDDSILEQIRFEPRRPATTTPSSVIDQIASLIHQSRKTVMVVGYGAIHSKAEKEIEQLCKQHHLLVATTLKGKGVIDEKSPYFIGPLGVTSDGAAYQTITQEADLLLILGASFNERTSYLWKPELIQDKKIIQIDHNPSQLEKVFSATLSVEADILDTLKALLEKLAQQPTSNTAKAQPRSAENGYQISERVKDKSRDETSISHSTPTLVRTFFSLLNNHFDEEISVFDDNIIYGQNFLQASPLCHYYPNSGISSLGYAIPAALGAALTHQHPVFAILGDGGFQMCGLELMTAVNYNIPINVVLLNNGSMGLIRKNQFQQYGGRYIDCDFINPDFSLLAQSFGISHIRIESDEAFDHLFNHCDLHKGINLIEIPIDKNAFPDYQSGR
ncbi:MAG TPA: thiamine pyrophosphate-binding protein, partial [Gammaproteobacteria bacterium]|nr:thiamine pyrophosphate-binding protein [Gammaproteobacteria bacterium]